MGAATGSGPDVFLLQNTRTQTRSLSLHTETPPGTPPDPTSAPTPVVTRLPPRSAGTRVATRDLVTPECLPFQSVSLRVVLVHLPPGTTGTELVCTVACQEWGLLGRNWCVGSSVKSGDTNGSHTLPTLGPCDSTRRPIVWNKDSTHRWGGPSKVVKVRRLPCVRGLRCVDPFPPWVQGPSSSPQT